MRRALGLSLLGALVGLVALPLTASGTPAPASAHALVKAAFNKALKTTILVDARGLTLYMFTEDVNGKATKCTPQGRGGPSARRYGRR